MLHRQFLSIARNPAHRRSSFILLVTLLMFSILPSCATVREQESGAAPEKARAGVALPPEEGDVKMVNGVEYIYGRNVRWLSLEGEPEYIWTRKDQYTARLSDSLNRALSGRAEDEKEMQDLRKRLDRLEADMKRADGASGGR